MKKWWKNVKRDVNILIGTILFILLIGSAFAVSWVFGVAFLIGFGLSIYNRTIEKKPFLPVLLFVGGFVIRLALVLFLPSIIFAKTYLELGISLVLFIVILITGWRIRNGKI